MRKASERPAARAADGALATYRAKRNFAITPEPKASGTRRAAAPDTLSFVIQKHWASRLHYDFRLELDGSLKSWAVPKGPSLDPHDKRLAVQVEDHPLSYASFEGRIPEGQYGAGDVIVWDNGSWEPLGDARAGLRNGSLKFALHGHKLQGQWALVRIKGSGSGEGHGRHDKQPPWLLIKEKDEFVRPAAEFSVTEALPNSVAGLPAGQPALPGPDTAAPADLPDIASLGRACNHLPQTLAPQLATLVDAPPPDAQDWLFEIKFDGYRILTRVDAQGQVQLITRSGKDWSARMPRLHAALAALKLPSGWYDGEIIVPDDTGRPSFSALQASFEDGQGGAGIMLYLFDLPICAGRDLRALPLQARRAQLRRLLAAAPADGPVRFSDAFEEDPQSLVASACRLGLEGLIGKRRDSHYSSGRSSAWIKLKCHQRQEFVIAGYTDPQGSRTGLGALLLAVHDAHGRLVYAGNVGTGFSQATLSALKKQLAALHAPASPFGTGVKIAGKPHWVKPELVAEVAFQEWTAGGHVRRAVFHALRSDKPAKAIVRETAVHQLKRRAAHRAARLEPPPRLDSVPPQQPLPAGLRITHAERVIDSLSGATKLSLLRYYNEVAPLMLPHLHQRPLALVRAPAGVGGELFFQKHLGLGRLEGVRDVPADRQAGTTGMVEVQGLAGLLSAAQWNVIEFHSLNASSGQLAKPDRMVFDLDPGEGVDWPQVREAAELTHSFLQQLGLPAFLKTSGGKGLHVVVPLRRQHGWDAVKGFSEAVVQHLAVTVPQRFVARSGPRNRVGKIFIDYLRNGASATTACAWSVRARPGLGVSVPVAWDELPALTGAAQWTLPNALARLAIGNTPWDGYEQSAASLAPAMKLLGYKGPSPRRAR